MLFGALYAQSMEGHHCRCSSWCQFYGMRPNDRCLSLSDEWTRSLEGCGGAVFDAHRLSFRILPVSLRRPVIEPPRARWWSMHVERVRSTLCHPSSTSTGRIAAHSPWSRRTPLAHEASCALALRRLRAFWDQGLTGMKTRSNGLKPIGSRHRPYIRTV